MKPYQETVISNQPPCERNSNAPEETPRTRPKDHLDTRANIIVFLLASLDLSAGSREFGSYVDFVAHDPKNLNATNVNSHTSAHSKSSNVGNRTTEATASPIMVENTRTRVDTGWPALLFYPSVEVAHSCNSRPVASGTC